MLFSDIFRKKKPEKESILVVVAGFPHTFAWGGVHGAWKEYSGEVFSDEDVASLYQLMIRYNLHAEIVDPQSLWTSIMKDWN